MTLTREQVLTLKMTLSDIVPDAKRHIDDLCDLALVSLAVQPRSIEEYTIGRVLVFVPGDGWIEAWRSPRKDVWSTDIYGLASSKDEKNFVVEPTHFIPLSSLPEPKI